VAALADSVEAGLSPVTSTLPPPADLVATHVLTDPTLRSRNATELARLLHVEVSDGVEAIAAIVGLAASRGKGPLRRHAGLERAIGPFLDTDTALERFGAHMGPIESDPNPHGAGSMKYGGRRGSAMGLAHESYAGELRAARSNPGGEAGTLDNWGAAQQFGWRGAYFDTDAGSLSWRLDEAGAGDDPTPPYRDPSGGGGGGGGSPSPAPPSNVAPSGGGSLTTTTVLGLPLLAVVAGGVGIYLLTRKKRRGRR
jgi:hypothetical protein